jgi:mannose/cellobiose epimerase-like protein (N-acyl-D-glucosamine 2-epimerase family)
LARSAGYEFYQENPAFLQFNAAAEASFPLDLLFVNDATFAKMQAATVPSPSGPEGLRVVSLMHLLALKCHAVKFGRPGRTVKDAEEVIQLIRRNRLDPNAGNVREIFQRHGTDEFYERVRGACAPN